MLTKEEYTKFFDDYSKLMTSWSEETGYLSLISRAMEHPLAQKATVFYKILDFVTLEFMEYDGQTEKQNLKRPWRCMVQMVLHLEPRLATNIKNHQSPVVFGEFVKFLGCELKKLGYGF